MTDSGNFDLGWNDHPIDVASLHIHSVHKPFHMPIRLANPYKVLSNTFAVG